MCGRAYITYTEEELFFRYQNLSIRKKPLDMQMSLNFSPTQNSNILRMADPLTSEFISMRWGLIPSWAKDIKSANAYSLINARSEEIKEKRSYSQAYQARRGIFPVSGYYEWKEIEQEHNGKGKPKKQQYAFHSPETPILSLAAIWEQWMPSLNPNESGTGQTPVFSFSILTESANSDVKDVHHRQPVILADELLAEWLNPKILQTDIIDSILKRNRTPRLSYKEIEAGGHRQLSLF